jgi:hypothetical protein
VFKEVSQARRPHDQTFFLAAFTSGQVETRGDQNSSSYEEMVTSLQRTFHGGLLVAANYTYSHEINQDAAGGFRRIFGRINMGLVS